MSKKSNLKHSIMLEMNKIKEGSFNTRAARKERLLLIAEQLAEGGYKIERMSQLKTKHIEYLVSNWLKKNLSAGTIKNRMTDLRWLMKKYDKEYIIPAKNDLLNIPKRQYVTNQDKSKYLSQGDLTKISDMDVKMSLLLQSTFGLRREEAIKIRIHEAVVGDELRLKGSWCKNGKARSINIQYPEQWQAIQQVKDYLGNHKRALIPTERNYAQQKNIYDQQTHRAGLTKLHGLRHAYAQKRYFDLTGWQCPAKSGLSRKDLSIDQKQKDQLARMQISLELGHERIDVVAQYCGS